ncbi:hypothetical protein [Streptomyces sp. CA-179760]|uniref:hypothetical protein n=1 Tax=Streptomyces sp. CA-179760 TaxID=3240054 RepID=UPI003D8A12FB
MGSDKKPANGDTAGNTGSDGTLSASVSDIQVSYPEGGDGGGEKGNLGTVDPNWEPPVS